MAKLVQFDLDRFRLDLRAWLDGEVHGGGWRLVRGSGISHGTYTRLANGSVDVGDIDTILSVLEFLGWTLDHYLLKGGAVRGHVIDWPLFKACASFLCGGNARELQRRSQISYQEAKTVLTHGICSDITLTRVCRAMKLRPAQLRPGWREERRQAA